MRHRERKQRRLVSEINVVPYIDVMLVLLVIFMITAPMMMQGVEVNLPEANSKPVVNNEPDRTLYVYVLASGKYGLNTGEDKSMETYSLDDLQSTIEKLIATAPDTPVYVEGDASVPYQNVMQVMSRLQSAGVQKLALITEPPEAR